MGGRDGHGGVRGGRILAAQAQPAGSAKAVFDAAAAARFANLALACAHQEYPNKIAHVMTSDADVKPPRELTPAFFGCYDWHSSVHGHWLLARLARLFPDAPFAPRARAELARSFTTENMAAEASYLAGPGRTSFERPYGLAWLLQLAAELREWKDPQAQQWASGARPARDGRRRAPEGMAAEALAPDPDRRARPDRLRVRPRARLGAHGRRSTDDRSDPVEDGGVLPQRQGVPVELRAERPGLPLAVHRGGRSHAPGARAAGVRGLVARVPAAGSRRRFRRLARASRGDRSNRSRSSRISTA